MHLFINAVSATVGSGLTYARNVFPVLDGRSDLRTTVFATRALCGEFRALRRIDFIEPQWEWGSAAGRFLREQMSLPGIIRRSGASVLLSAGNFALFRAPVPQILLVGNSLYWSADFYRDIRARGRYALWLRSLIESVLARSSIRRSEGVIAPTLGFAETVSGRSADGRKISVIPHGFDSRRFFTAEPLPEAVAARLALAQGCLRLLCVSHYNWFRDFDTLVRGLAELKRALPGRSVKLILTCELSSKPEWGPYDPSQTARLAEDLGVRGDIIELGLVPYHLLNKLYAACDLYVSAAYTESFALPLVEAMASGLPVVASDIPAHRSVCGEAALYFPKFSSEMLAKRVVELTADPGRMEAIRLRASARARDFSWEDHVDALAALARELTQ